MRQPIKFVAVALVIAGFSTVAPADAARAATAAVLYDNGVGPYNPWSTNAEDWPYPYDDSDVERADDFVVPARTRWSITTIVVNASHDGRGILTTSASTYPSKFRIRVYRADGPNLAPGTADYERTVGTPSRASETDGYERVTFTLADPIVVTSPGKSSTKYWVSVQAVTELTDRTWFWTARGFHNSASMERRPSGHTCTSWCAPIGGPFDLAFRVDGTAARV